MQVAKTTATLVAVSALMLASPAGKAEGLSIGARAGLLGVGADITKSISPAFNARLSFNYWGASYDDTIDDITFNVDARLQTIGLLLDWHPRRGSFRLTGGIVANQNRGDFESVIDPASIYIIGDNAYTGAQIGTLVGKITFAPVAPYVGVGWGNSVADGKHWGFNVELGILYQGSPKVRYSANGTAAGTAAFQEDLRREEQLAESDFEDFKIFPVVALGVSYRF